MSETDKIEKLGKIIKIQYPDLNEDEIYTMAKQALAFSLFLVRLWSRNPNKQQENRLCNRLYQNNRESHNSKSEPIENTNSE